MRVLLATCRELPEPDPDQQLLLEALAARGVEASMLAWDGPEESPDRADLCVLRSTWNYYSDRPAFLRWLSRLEARMPVLNPPGIVRWNTDKKYLADLQARGLPVVPTVLLEAGEPFVFERLMAERGWDDVVVKPRVSAGSFATRRFQTATASEGQEFLASQLSQRPMMVQPYQSAIEKAGERAVVWIDGALSHAVRKSPRFSGHDESVSEALPIAGDERRLAEAVLAGLPRDLLYARIDMVRDTGGSPVLMELELTEPSLFLAQFPPALDRLASAIAARAGASGRSRRTDRRVTGIP